MTMDILRFFQSQLFIDILPPKILIHMAPRKIEKKNDNELLHEKENENKLKKIKTWKLLLDFYY